MTARPGTAAVAIIRQALADFADVASWKRAVEADRARQRIAELEQQLAHQTKLAELAERAMRSAHEAAVSFEARAQKHLDAKEPLEVIADAAAAFVEAQDPCARGDFAGDKYDDLKRALKQRPR